MGEESGAWGPSTVQLYPMILYRDCSKPGIRLGKNKIIKTFQSPLESPVPKCHYTGDIFKVPACSMSNVCHAIRELASRHWEHCCAKCIWKSPSWRSLKMQTFTPQRGRGVILFSMSVRDWLPCVGLGTCSFSQLQRLFRVKAMQATKCLRTCKSSKHRVLWQRHKVLM